MEQCRKIGVCVCVCAPPLWAKLCVQPFAMAEFNEASHGGPPHGFTQAALKIGGGGQTASDLSCLIVCRFYSEADCFRPSGNFRPLARFRTGHA